MYVDSAAVEIMGYGQDLLQFDQFFILSKPACKIAVRWVVTILERN